MAVSNSFVLLVLVALTVLAVAAGAGVPLPLSSALVQKLDDGPRSLREVGIRRSLADIVDVEDNDEDEGESEFSSFVAAATELHRAPQASGLKPAQPTLVALSETAAMSMASGSWEERFQLGMHYSKVAEEADDRTAGAWAFDFGCSGAGVPRQFLRAEELLLASADEAPVAQQKSKNAERALRLYHHAKWLAERNYARAAEWRYREAARLAKQNKRSVLAAHSLSRLGYFLIHWKRFEEAREVLLESEKLSTKSNPLAPYLYGVLERQTAGPDAERLRVAEERILGAGAQPSEDLEVARTDLVREIGYWRVAEGSPRGCIDTSNVAHAIICLCCHGFFALQQAAA